MVRIVIAIALTLGAQALFSQAGQEPQAADTKRPHAIRQQATVCDVNGDSVVDVRDVFFLLNHLFGPPPPAPSTPTGLSATALASNRIDVTWNEVADATSYDLYRSETSGSGYSKIASRTVAGYGDLSVTASHTYDYVVRAVNEGGESNASNEAFATTGSSGPSGRILDPQFICGDRDMFFVTLATVTEAVAYEAWVGPNTGGPYPERVTSSSPSFTVGHLLNLPQVYVIFQLEDASGNATVSLDGERPVTCN